MLLDGHSAIVTGGGSGLGAETARQLAAVKLPNGEPLPTLHRIEEHLRLVFALLPDMPRRPIQRQLLVEFFQHLHPLRPLPIPQSAGVGAVFTAGMFEKDQQLTAGHASAVPVQNVGAAVEQFGFYRVGLLSPHRDGDVNFWDLTSGAPQARGAAWPTPVRSR